MAFAAGHAPPARSIKHGERHESDHIAGIWQQVRGEIKEIVGTLANAPKLIAAGLRDQHAGRNRERLGISHENAARQLKEFHLRNRNWKLLGH